MVWIIYKGVAPSGKLEKPEIINYFDTKKEAEDYLVEIGVRKHKLFFHNFFKCLYGDELYKGEMKDLRLISYEQYELLEETYPEIAKINNFFKLIQETENPYDFTDAIAEDMVKIVLNNTDYHDSVLKFMFSKKFNLKYELYEKPGKLFF